MKSVINGNFTNVPKKDMEQALMEFYSKRQPSFKRESFTTPVVEKIHIPEFVYTPLPELKKKSFKRSNYPNGR